MATPDETARALKRIDTRVSLIAKALGVHLNINRPVLLPGGKAIRIPSRHCAIGDITALMQDNKLRQAQIVLDDTPIGVFLIE